MPFEPFDILRRLGRQIPTSIIQVGAHNAHEISDYLMYGVSSSVLIDPLSDCIYNINQSIKDCRSYIAVQAVCSNISGIDVDFHVASNWGASSSLLRPANHTVIHPEVKFDTIVRMKTRTLDEILAETRSEYGLMDPFELVFLDCQGAELMVLQGASRALAEASYVYTKVSHGGLYEDDVVLSDLLGYLRVWGFDLYDLKINDKNYGNALFIRRGK